MTCSSCADLGETWSEMARDGHTWEAMCAMECSTCAYERQRRNRLAASKDPRLSRAPFLDAPYVHQNNEPKYHALLTRALEHAKRNEEGVKHVLWVVAKDKPHDAPEFRISKDLLDKKRARWLQLHDQQTGGIPGLFPLYKGLRMRTTERISKKLKIWKHTPCTVYAWDLHPSDKQLSGVGERMLQEQPLCIYVHFESAQWQIHPGLPLGVLPLTPVKRTFVFKSPKNRRNK